VVPPGTTAPQEEIERLRPGLQIMALHALGDREAADEIVQETLVRALEALQSGRFRDTGDLGAFVRGIARHVIADTLRARQRRASLNMAPPTGGGATLENPLSRLITQEESSRLRAALARLSPEDQNVLSLSYLEGMTPREIGETSGEPAARIRKRKSRALQRLRVAFLGSQEPDGGVGPAGDRGKRVKHAGGLRILKGDSVGDRAP
jgi:RNA polymerase sigma-70 factor (ECF subfamily)